ncbi:MAG: DNA polymerase III subunit gamma/tau [Flavonifractor plautii]
MYQALYRKWRPRTFDDVVGQSHITDTLKRQVATGRLSHAYLFTGTRGTGKTTCAKILARAVNCEHPVDGNPCNQCPSCLGIESGSILDVLELDAASNNGVDQVRALRDEAVYTPAAVRKRVYIVDEVHMLSTAAFNALLKILEEPPEHLMFILATTELHKVPATIKSRCQQFSFKRILPGDIAARLAYVAREEGIELRGRGPACWPGWPTAACGTHCPCWTSAPVHPAPSGSRRCWTPWGWRATWRRRGSWSSSAGETPPGPWRPWPGCTARGRTWALCWASCPP